MSDYTNECYNSGFLLDKDYLPYETKVNDEVLGLIFRTLFKLPDNATSGTDTSPDFSGYKAKAKAKGLIQDATVFGGLNLASSFYDGNKNYSKYLGLDLIGVEFAKDPSGYTASRIVNNVKRNNLISVASTSTKNWLIKNGYEGNIAVGNPICLLHKLGLFNERAVSSKKKAQRIAFIVGPKEVSSANIANNEWAEYDAIQSVLNANDFEDLGQKSVSIYNTLRTLTNARCVVTNSATIYEAAIVVGAFPIFLRTSYNDCEYALRAFCKDLDIPFNYTLLDTLLSDYSRYTISENNGTFQDGEWDHDFDSDDVYDYRILGNPYPKIIENNNNLLASLPLEWKALYSNLYNEKTIIKILNKSSLLYTLYIPSNTVIKKKGVCKYYDTALLSDVELPSVSSAQRLNNAYGISINNLYYQEKDITNTIKVYGEVMYFHISYCEYENVFQTFFKMFLNSVGLLQYGTEELLSFIGKDSFSSSLILNGIFLKNPKKYKQSRIANSLSTKSVKSVILNSDKNYLVSKNLLSSDIPVVNPFAWCWLKFESWISERICEGSGPIINTLVSNKIYEELQQKQVPSINVSIPKELPDSDRALLVSKAIYSIYANNFAPIYTDDILTYIISEYANRNVFYINESGCDNYTFSQIYEFAKQIKNPVIALDYNTINNIKGYSLDEGIIDRIIRRQHNSSADYQETYNFIKFFKANFYNSNFDTFVYRISQEPHKSDVLITFAIDDTASRKRFEDKKKQWIQEYSSDKYKLPVYKNNIFNIAVIDHYEWDPMYKQIVDELSSRQFPPLQGMSDSRFNWYVQHSIFESEGSEPTNITLYKRIPDTYSRYSLANQPNTTAFINASYNGYSNVKGNIEIQETSVINVTLEDIRVWDDSYFRYEVRSTGGNIVYE